MDAYALVKSGKLKLKGHEDKPKKRKRKSSGPSLTSASKVIRNAFSDDLAAHGGWWEISKFADIIGPVAIQMTGLAPAQECSSSSADQPLPIPPAYYLSASDDGFVNLGPPRREGEPPAPEEIFTAVKVSDTKVAFKTGYDKYMTANTSAQNLITAAADAIGPREQFEPVFQDGKSALLGFNNCFVSVDTDSDRAICRAQKAGPTEMLVIRSNKDLTHNPLNDLPEEERHGTKKAEYLYVRKFQSWQDKKIRLTREDTVALKDAKRVGNLHECMLDRREKMKSDRYCK
ncbi:Protein FRG1 [Taenia solium]|eukprot:TsM_000567700 transcript=TsM_000567700 gene=TsM_000567700